MGYFARIPQRLIAAIMAFGSGVLISALSAVAAGAILAMLSDTMIPEAFEEAHEFAGLMTVLGLLVAFILTKISL